jgi:flagellar hook-basal body complex protein FliE
MNIGFPIAARTYADARTAVAPRPAGAEAAAGQPGGAASAATSFVQTLRETELTARAGMVGGADPHSLVQALASTELAVETAVTIRDRVVEAYQEILRMPV